MFSSSWILLSSSMSSPLQSSWLSWYPRKLPITWLWGKLENTGLMIVSGAFTDASADQTCLQTGLQKFCTPLCSRIRTQRLHQADYCFLFPICRLHLTDCILYIVFCKLNFSYCIWRWNFPDRIVNITVLDCYLRIEFSRLHIADCPFMIFRQHAASIYGFVFSYVLYVCMSKKI